MESLYAKIIVNNNSNYTDDFFTYKVPISIGDELKIGHRVLVPFGRGNKLIEGFVFEIIDEFSESYKLKSIDRILDERPLLSEKEITLINWMRNEYLCTYMDCINCMYPKGLRVDNVKMVKLLVDEPKDLTKNELSVVNELKINKNELELNKLTNNLNIKIENILSKLKEKSIVDIYWDHKETVNEKFIKVVTLTISDDEVDLNVKQLIKRRGFKQAQILNFLKNNPIVQASHLKEMFDVNNQVLKALEDKQLIAVNKEELLRTPINTYSVTKKTVTLNDEQINAVNKINEDLIKENKKPFLLFGVTGSGKTEVYIEVIKNAVDKGLDCIVLVPEIALTPQTIARFKNVFGEIIAVFHSQLSVGEKYDEYKRVRRSEAKIIIGARSAIFAPCNNLGVIIIDEFHETSYKSEMNPKYSTVDIAKEICMKNGVTLVLGSATPPVEEYYKCTTDEYEKIELKIRANEKEMPKIELVDMKYELELGNRSIFSGRLQYEMKKALSNSEQVILFLNKRGYANFVSCRKCGYIYKCKKCDISLTYHKHSNSGVCHYCGYEKTIAKECPSCQSNYIKEFGVGTQKIEEEIRLLFPQETVLRMDSDTTRKKGSLEKILEDFKNRKANILIGTQMVSKGHDFPNVTLVGVLSGDTMLNFPDFKSSEKTFQLITQVAGRAGRSALEGKVILQVYDTDHYAIKYAQKYDYEGFYMDEIKIRKLFNYTPFNNLISVVVSGKVENIVINNAMKISDAIKYLLGKRGYTDFEFILGPNPCIISRINDNYRWQILIKDLNVEIAHLRSIMKYICIQKRDELFDKNVAISMDVNPTSIL